MTSKETEKTISEMKELTKLVRELREELERKSKSFIAMEVAEHEDEYFFISGMSTGSFSSQGTDHEYADDAFIESFTKQYKEEAQC